ncbi:hypothetical protein D3C72_1431970 [compost metagenome]
MSFVSGATADCSSFYNARISSRNILARRQKCENGQLDQSSGGCTHGKDFDGNDGSPAVGGRGGGAGRRTGPAADTAGGGRHFATAHRGTCAQARGLPDAPHDVRYRVRHARHRRGQALDQGRARALWRAGGRTVAGGVRQSYRARVKAHCAADGNRQRGRDLARQSATVGRTHLCRQRPLRLARHRRDGCAERRARRQR